MSSFDKVRSFVGLMAALTVLLAFVCIAAASLYLLLFGVDRSMSWWAIANLILIGAVAFWLWLDYEAREIERQRHSRELRDSIARAKRKLKS